jgi:hypothetical protein
MKPLWELRLGRQIVRDKNKIPVIIDLLTKIWIQNPDMRLCQLIGNVFHGIDPYYIEDDKLEDLLRERYNVS